MLNGNVYIDGRYVYESKSLGPISISFDQYSQKGSLASSQRDITIKNIK